MVTPGDTVTYKGEMKAPIDFRHVLSRIAAISGLYDGVVGALLLCVPCWLAATFGVPAREPPNLFRPQRTLPAGGWRRLLPALARA